MRRSRTESLEHKVHVVVTLHASKNSNEKDAVDAILGSPVLTISPERTMRLS